ncbi:MAG: hypothetical protein JW838_16075, partial [Spirochaetes bacterium]|nr:hypothetical protein [Spirochaetota bacterium]
MTSALIAILTVWLQVSPYTFDDVVRDIVPGRKGGPALKEIAHLLEKTTLRVDRSKKTEKFNKFMISTLERFDFMKLWKSRYFTDIGEGFRGVRIEGRNREEGYAVNLVEPGGQPGGPSRMWDYDTVYALKKNDRSLAGGRSFVVSIRSRTATGRYSHRNGMAFVGGLLRVIDPASIGRFNATECGLFANLEGESRGVVNDFHRSFPRVSRFFNRYTIIRSLVSTREYEGIPYTHCDIRYGYRMDALGKDYPRLAKAFMEIRGLYLITMDFRNETGDTILALVFDSRDDVLSCTFYTRNGRFVPFDSDLRPLFNREIAPGAVKNFSYHAVMDMVHNVHGLKFTTKGTILRFRYHDSPKKGFVTARIQEVGRTVISGRFYNVLPPWLIDLFVPNNMEQLIAEVSRVMAAAHDGRGTSVRLGWDTGNPADVKLDFSAVSEFVDNYFIRYGLRVWSKKMLADESFNAEARKVTGKLLEALR